MKIAIISPWSVNETSVGGTERFVIDIAETLKKEKNIVDVYMMSGESHSCNGVNYININLFNDNCPSEEEKIKKYFGDFTINESFNRLAKRLEELIDINQYDIVQLNSQLFLEAFKEKKRIFTIHTNPYEYKMNFGNKSFEKMIEIMKKQRYTYFITPSEYYRDIYTNLTNLKIACIPHAIDLQRIEKEEKLNDILKKYEIDKNYKYILLPSRLEPVQKQPLLFMKAFSKIQNKEKYQVICTGADNQYKKYASGIKEFCKENNINLKIIRFDYMYEAYRIADIVVLPSKSESFGYSALESLGLGIPTILNKIPTYLEIANDSQNSYIFNGTEESLIEQLKKVCNSDLTRKKQTKLWKDRYDLKLFGRRYLNLMEE